MILFKLDKENLYKCGINYNNKHYEIVLYNSYLKLKDPSFDIDITDEETRLAWFWEKCSFDITEDDAKNIIKIIKDKLNLDVEYLVKESE